MLRFVCSSLGYLHRRGFFIADASGKCHLLYFYARGIIIMILINNLGIGGRPMKVSIGVLFHLCRLGPEFLFSDPRLSALTTCGSFMGLPSTKYRIYSLVQVPHVV